MAWLKRRLPPPAPARLDVLVAVGRHDVPPGLTPGEAVQAIRAATTGLPDAGALFMEQQPERPGDSPVLWVQEDATDPKRAHRLRAVVEQRIAGALARAAASRTPARPALQGFAEAPLRDLAPAPFAAATPARDAGVEAELLQRLLACATGVPANPAAARALAAHGSLARVLAAPVHELLELPGLGEHSAAAIKIVHAVALRGARSALIGQVIDGMDGSLIAYLQAAIARERVEQFRILFLDGAGRLLADEAQARGTVNHTPVYPREVAKRALELRAASLILVHNHPSGDPTPSKDDLVMTGLVRDALAAVGVALRDHIIVVTARSLSFAEAGLL